MKTLGLFGLVMVIIIAVILFPFMLPVGLNYLGYQIPLNIETWFGSFLIYGFISTAASVGGQRK